MNLEFRKSPHEFFLEGCGCDDCCHGHLPAQDPHVRCKLYAVDAQGVAHRLKMDICGTCLENRTYQEDPRYQALDNSCQ